MNPLSRFKPLDHLPLSPGVCFICKGGIGPFIDTSLTVDFEGAIYVCISCIKEMFSQLGLNSVINDEEVNEKIEAAFRLGLETGRVQTMETFSEFVNSYADRLDSSDAIVTIVPRPDNVAIPVGATKSSPKSASDSVEGDGIASLQELGELSGNSSDGEQPIFNLD